MWYDKVVVPREGINLRPHNVVYVYYAGVATRMLSVNGSTSRTRRVSTSVTRITD